MASTHITSDAQRINKPAEAVYELFSDLSRFATNLPEDKKNQVKVTPDTLVAQAQGMELGVQITQREAPRLIVMEQFGKSPFPFTIKVHLEPIENTQECHLTLDLDAQMSGMIKMMLGNKLKDFVNQFSVTIAQGLNK